LVLSKRERLIAMTSLGAISVLALDRMAIEPLLAANADLNAQIEARQKDLQDAQSKIEGRRHRARIWAQMQNKGLRRKDVSEAESQLLNNIREWAQESGMTVVSVKPERTEPVSIKPGPNEREKKVFYRSTFRVSGTGGMGQISRFLWHVGSADMPASVADLQISTRKEATDDLSLQAGISTICLIPDDEKDAQP
jgi:hypothetical protein